MRLLKLTLDNIRSYGSEEIIFPHGSTLLSGDVGSGKTTILLAIEYALFGLQPGQRGSTLLSNSSDEGSVKLEIEVEGQVVTIERKMKRSAKSINQESATISYGGQKQELSLTELKIQVLNFLGYPAEFIKKTNLLYRYTVYSPQEEMKQIILEDSETRLDILRHIFGIDKYRTIKENATLIASKLREQSRALNIEVRGLDVFKTRLQGYSNEIQRLETNSILISKKIEERKNSRKLIESKISELSAKKEERRNFEKEIEKTQVLISQKKQNKSDQDKEIVKSQSLLDEKVIFEENILMELKNQSKQKKIEVENLQKQLISVGAQISSYEMRKNEDLEKKKRIFSIDLCPTCLQDVSENHKRNIMHETENNVKNTEKLVSELREQREKITPTHNKESKNLLEIEQRIVSLEVAKARSQERASLRQRAEELVKNRDSLVKDLAFLEKHLLELKSSLLELSKFDNLIRLGEQELKNAFTEEKKAEIELAEIKKEKEVIARDKVNLEKEMQEKEILQVRLANLTSLEQWLSQDFTELMSLIERNIMLKLRKEFSSLFNKWFSMLTTDSFSIQLDENFTPVILQGGFEIDYSSLSGGERTAVALAYRLSLNQILNSVHSTIKTRDLIILDEPTDGFSEQQLDRVRDILKELQTNQLIIVSHESKIESFVDNIVKVEKQSGKSSVNSPIIAYEKI